ncbi:hypothetical protein HQ520_07580, partial [bacterium]|nr:hypothetical protein [bacterium]
ASFAKFMNRVSRPSLFDGGFDISDYRTTAGVDVPGAAEKSAVQWTAVLTQIIETGVASDLTSTVNVYTASQTVSRLLWSRAGGATTVQTTFGDSHGLPLMSDPGERLIVQVIVAGTTPACNDLQLAGYIGELAA